MAYNIFDPFILFIIYLHFSLDTLRHDRFTEERRQERLKYQEDQELPEDEDEELFARPRESVKPQHGVAFLRDLRWMLKYNGISIPHMLIYASYVLNLVIFFLITMIYSAFSHTRQPETKRYMNPVLRHLEHYHIVDMFAKYENTRQFNLAMAINLLIALLNKWIYCYGHLRRAKMNRYQYKHLSIVQSTINYIRTLNLSTDGWLDLGRQALSHECKNGDCFKERPPSMEHKMMFQVSKIDRVYYHNVIDFTWCFENWRTHDKKRKPSKKATLLDRLIDYVHPDDNKYFVAQPKYRIDIKELSLLVISYVFSVFLATITILICNYSFWHLAFVEAAEAGVDLQETTSARVEWLMCNLLLAISGTECGTILLTGIFCYSRIKQITRLIDNELVVQRLYLRHFVHCLDRTEAQVMEFLVATEPNRTSKPASILTDQHFLKLRRQFKEQIDPFILMHHNENLDYIVSLIGVLKDELSDFKRAYTVIMNVITIFGLASTTIILTIARKSNSWSEILIALPLVLLSATPIIFCSVTSAMVESAFRDNVKKLGFVIGDGLELLDTDVNLRMNGMYEHLTQLNNRSFILFANFPLSFSSLMTICAWICNVYQAMVEQGLVW